MRPPALISPLIILGILGGSVLFAYILTHPQAPKVVVTIREGATVNDINKLLREKGVLAEDLSEDLEGYLFPDTYEFFVPSGVAVVEARFRENFNQKIRPIIPAGSSEEDLKEILTKASLIEKEVPDFSERKIVAGIMMKRLENNIPLQLDASLCYEKDPPCFPITRFDKKLSSPFNTYLYSGLPPRPISNPGVDAVLAVLNPVATPYWFYLSDPESKKTIFSRTLDEHNDNIVKYLNTTN
ncbi:MAG: endolytic transglycosylase MltG [Candidatus Colwellbacteria bacterium]